MQDIIESNTSILVAYKEYDIDLAVNKNLEEIGASELDDKVNTNYF